MLAGMPPVRELFDNEIDLFPHTRRGETAKHNRHYCERTYEEDTSVHMHIPAVVTYVNALNCPMVLGMVPVTWLFSRLNVLVVVKVCAAGKQTSTILTQ